MDLKSYYREYEIWDHKNKSKKIPIDIAKEGAGENRIPFAHLANSLPVYFIFSNIIKKSRKKKSYILDVGCGTGREIAYLSDSLNEKKFNFVGIDYSKACIKYAKNHYSKKNLVFNKYQGRIFPFKKESFNFVCSSHVLEHIPKKEANFFIQEILRVTKKGGVIVIGTPNRKNCQDLFVKNPKELKRYRLILPHEHEYYYQELIELLKYKKNGFKKFLVLETHNKYNRTLMKKSIEKIRPGKTLPRKIIFFFYSQIRKFPPMQDLLARLGTELILKSMKIDYKKFCLATYVKPAKREFLGDNFVLIIQK